MVKKKYSKSFLEHAKEHKLDEEEMEQLWLYEKAIAKSYKENDKIRELVAEAAENHFAKDNRVNIRLSSRTLDAIKYRAMREGLPYQTLISSILHKYATGQLNG